MLDLTCTAYLIFILEFIVSLPVAKYHHEHKVKKKKISVTNFSEYNSKCLGATE